MHDVLCVHVVAPREALAQINVRKLLRRLVPAEGLEPPTYRLQGGCSTN